MHRDVGYDPRKDFAPIGLIAAAPSLLLLHPDLKIRSVSELIAMMKRADPPFQVGVPGIGTVNHLASVLFAQQAGVKVQQIPYKGSNRADHRPCRRPCEGRLQSHPGLARGARIQVDRCARGDLAARSTALPDVPTVAESGLPGFDAVLSYGLLAPAGTPRPIIDTLNKDLRAALATEEVKQRLLQEGAEPMPTTPEEHAAVIDREETKWSTLIHSVGLKAE